MAMVDRAAWREIWRRTGKTERRGGYSRSWRGVYRAWRDMIEATPIVPFAIRVLTELPLCRGQFNYRRPTWHWREAALSGDRH